MQLPHSMYPGSWGGLASDQLAIGPLASAAFKYLVVLSKCLVRNVQLASHQLVVRILLLLTFTLYKYRNKYYLS